MKTSRDILAIDDEAVIRQGIARICGGEGLSVDAVDGGAAGLERLARCAYRLVLCDIMMENLDGFQFLEQAAVLGSRAPVVMVTGYSTVENAVRSLRRGAIDFIAKPFTADELLAVVRRGFNYGRLMEVADTEGAARPVTHCPPRYHRLGQMSWAAVEPVGAVLIGVNDIFARTTGAIQRVVLSSAGSELVQGRACAAIVAEDDVSHGVISPLSGRIVDVNALALADPAVVARDPYGDGWLYRVLPSELEYDLGCLDTQAASCDTAGGWKRPPTHCVAQHARQLERDGIRSTAMGFGLVFVFVVVCVVVDLALRAGLRKIQQRKQRLEREQALSVSLKLDFTREARTLKRAEVRDQAARILCVDDEPVVLDSLRKILVLDGYSVDTVQTGQEMLGLVQTHHYDFVFTDLRMPEMDGVDVVKAVKHMRPDIDVIIITGYATVETAVECMKFGAMDYVQKPFTEEELRSFVKKALIKRRDRIEKQLKPRIQITHATETGAVRAGEFSIPGGVLISAGHCWASVSQDGSTKVGLDDFAKKLIGRVDGIEFPNASMTVRAGQPLFAVRQNGRRIQFHAPLSGQVLKVNQALNEELEGLDVTSYHNHWICVIDGENLDIEIPALKIGKSAVALFQDDIERFVAFAKANAPEGATNEALCIGAMARLDNARWEQAAREFFGR